MQNKCQVKNHRVSHYLFTPHSLIWRSNVVALESSEIPIKRHYTFAPVHCFLGNASGSSLEPAHTQLNPGEAFICEAACALLIKFARSCCESARAALWAKRTFKCDYCFCSSRHSRRREKAPEENCEQSIRQREQSTKQPSAVCVCVWMRLCTPSPMPQI
jgi:sulfatase maturation enzyme AslB (radical SAM superfamily)